MPTATSTLATLGTLIVNTIVDLATTVIGTYWPYFLVFGFLAALMIWGRRLIGMGHR